MGVAMAAISIGTAVYGGVKANQEAKKSKKSQKSAAKANYAYMMEKVGQVEDMKNLEIDQVRIAAIQTRSQQVTAAAARGVMIGDGSAQAMVDYTTKLSEQDAWVETLNRDNTVWAMTEQAKIDQEFGLTRADATGAIGKSSLLSSVAQGFGTAASAYYAAQ